ncbi:MAG: division/cell wall cluster transcriptional repressor MraZ [Pseudomonadota bacterium]|nr:division/cell wall cluster transcriptional repressor MraZ [Pseudomonadota bacterium]
MGTHQSRFDAKGRMSVPASFRAVLRSFAVEGQASLILRPSHTLDCIDAWPASRFDALAAGFDKIDLFSEDQDDLATTLYADAWPVEPDREGRIVVPDSLVQHAGLTESVVFMGLGVRFQIWEPTAALQRKMNARQGAVTRSLTVPAIAK